MIIIISCVAVFQATPPGWHDRAMPVPEFIADLRARIGHDPLWLIGTTAVVIRGGSEVLLIERADNGCWTPVTGIVDPGEEPADAAVREVAEETGATAVPTRLAWVHATAPVVHANGDRAQYLDHVFLMDWVAGEPRPDGEESTAAGWFASTRCRRCRRGCGTGSRPPAVIAARPASSGPARPVSRQSAETHSRVGRASAESMASAQNTTAR
ncbi:Diadenosine hexaphosphate hydrolase [Mycobacterium talmoniae]|uniref:Diadenosine hexaphosphate hydrolase n=1 Tax=Mycobacterium talmoniae TaxID=1858794 RepID=A0A2S8BL91_9MYCO|nr:Diadenosine hexaphosphate hydrolase [Mycobacterium talmoniae]